MKNLEESWFSLKIFKNKEKSGISDFLCTTRREPFNKDLKYA